MLSSSGMGWKAEVKWSAIIIMLSTSFAWGGELSRDVPVNLSQVGGKLQTSRILVDPKTDKIEVRIKRPTTAEPLAWDSSSTMKVTIGYFIDGTTHACSGQVSGGVRVDRLGVEMPEYILKYKPTVQYDEKTDTFLRIGERGKTEVSAYIELELLRGTIQTEIILATTTESSAQRVEVHRSVAYDAATSAQDVSGDGIITINHDPAGTNLLAAFAGSGNSAGALAKSGVTTYDGSAMTEDWDTLAEDWANAGYHKTGISADAKDYVNDLDGAPDEHVFGIITFTGVNQSDPVTTDAQDMDGGANPSVDISDIAADGMVVDNLYLWSTSITGGANQTIKNTEDVSGALGFRQSVQDGSDGGVMSYTVVAAAGGIGAIGFKSANTFYEQEGYRWRSDDGSESAASWLEAQDTNITRPNLTNTRLRMLVDTLGESGSNQYQLEYKRQESASSEYEEVVTATAENSTPTVVAIGTIAAAATAVSPAWPAGHQEDDIGIMIVATRGSDAIATIPTGWTEVSTSPQINGGGGGGNRLTMLWKRATSSSEATLSIGDAGNHTAAVIGVFRGIPNTGNPWEAICGGIKGPASTIMYWGTTNTINSNTLIVLAASRGNDSSAAAWSNAFSSGLVNITEQFDAGTTAGDGGGLTLYTAEKLFAGEVGGTTVTVASSSNCWITMALRPSTHPHLVDISTSDNINNAGEATTAQLTPPTTGEFTAGKINDVLNPAGAVTVSSGGYTEMEWCMQATNQTTNGQVFQFRMTKSGTIFDTYSTTPTWTIGTAAVTAEPPRRRRPIGFMRR